MKAAITDGKGNLWLADVPTPAVGEYQCLCKTQACATCTGTDRKHIEDKLPWSQNYPGILGHESIGYVVEVGPKVRTLKEGDTVLRPAAVYPGEQLGEYYSMWGGFAEYGLVTDRKALLEDQPDAQPNNYTRFQLPIPEGLGLSPADATMLITLKETASYVASVGVKLHSSLLILGAGSVALSMCRFAKVFGAYPVIMIGRRAAPLEHARKIGADFTINTQEQNPVEAARAITDGEGVDFIIDATGDAEFLNSCLPALKPDGNMQARIDVETRERTDRVRSQLTDEEARKIAAEAYELDQRSTEPNSPEALETLPQLKIRDLPKHPFHIPASVECVGGATLLRNDVFSNGVNYLALNFDLKGLPEELWVYLPYYWEAISKLGARGMGYEQLAQRRAACTGALWCRPEFLTHAEDGERSRWSLRFSLTTLDARMGEALSLMHDLLFGVDPGDRDRLHNVLLQIRAQRRADMTHQGHHIVLLQACRGLTPEGHLYDTAYGLPQLTLAEHLADTFEESNDDLMAKIEAVRGFLLARGRVTASFTGSDGPFSEVCTALPDWLSRMDGEPVSDAPIGFVPFDKPPREGLAVPIQVAHCLQVFRAPHHSHPDMPALVVGAHLVDLDYMVPQIRFKGNAYGALFRYDPFLRYFGLGSYQDPHIKRTFEVFAGVTDYVHSADWTQTDIDRAIIATAKREMEPIRPGNATHLALHRHVTGQSPELREERYGRFQAVTPEDAKRALLEHLEANRHRSAMCVISSREKLEEANAETPNEPLAIEDVLS